MTMMHKIIRINVRRSMGMMLEMYPPSNGIGAAGIKAAKDILPTVSFKIKFEDAELCALWAKKKIQKDAVQKPCQPPI